VAQETISVKCTDKGSSENKLKKAGGFVFYNVKKSRLIVLQSSKDIIFTMPDKQKEVRHLDFLNNHFFNADKSLTTKATNKFFKEAIPKQSFVELNGGFVSYNFNYRSNMDTPFIDKNIVQHNAYGGMNISLFSIPFRVNYLLRRSNSNLFNDINDVQIEFDARQYNSGFRSAFKEKFLKEAAKLNDSLLELNYKSTLEKLKISSLWFNDPLVQQKFTESREILTIPGLSYNTRYSDSSNKNNSAKIKDSAQVFINEYDSKKQELDQLKSKADALELDCRKMYSKMQLYKNLIENNLDGNGYLGRLQESMSSFGVNGINIPKKYRFLSGIQKFGIGRNQLNYSELTIKNMSLTGVNFEYNSWYYLAFATGKLDYRFRDFVVSPIKRNTQHLTMARIGVGRLEGNHLIITAYTGEKRLFTVTNNSAGQQQSINISGFAAEVKFKINPNAYLTAEIAQSISPDFRTVPVTSTKFNFNDNSNKAMALNLYSYSPKFATRIEGSYKYAGANFQSFSSFQSNSTIKQWHIKVDQQLFKRKLKLVASLRTNEFSNPYIIQNYQSNTILKSIQITYRNRKYPKVTVGYQPTSQLTAIDGQFAESKFYSFNTIVSHSYRVGDRKGSSVFVFNRFFNNAIDTGSLYYNAKNIFYNQTVVFSDYTMNVSLSHSKSTSFELNILDGGLQFKVSKLGLLGFGFRVNSFDKTTSKLGAYCSIQFSVGKIGVLNMGYDDGFIPGANHYFLKNKTLNLNYTKAF
jgi:hypothetical protein